MGKIHTVRITATFETGDNVATTVRSSNVPSMILRDFLWQCETLYGEVMSVTLTYLTDTSEDAPDTLQPHEVIDTDEGDPLEAHEPDAWMLESVRDHRREDERF